MCAFALQRRHRALELFPKRRMAFGVSLAIIRHETLNEDYGCSRDVGNILGSEILYSV